MSAISTMNNPFIFFTRGSTVIKFEKITEESIKCVRDIVNSNHTYNILENGNPSRSSDEVRGEFLNPKTESFLIVINNKYIGIIDFLKNNPRDHYPWLGLLMIHADFQSLGYGKKAYQSFEEKLKLEKFKYLRLGVLQKNETARGFWKSLGFEYYGNSEWEGNIIDCYEKNFK